MVVLVVFSKHQISKICDCGGDLKSLQLLYKHNHYKHNDLILVFFVVAVNRDGVKAVLMNNLNNDK